MADLSSLATNAALRTAGAARNFVDGAVWGEKVRVQCETFTSGGSEDTNTYWDIAVLPKGACLLFVLAQGSNMAAATKITVKTDSNSGTAYTAESGDLDDASVIIHPLATKGGLAGQVSSETTLVAHLSTDGMNNASGETIDTQVFYTV